MRITNICYLAVLLCASAVSAEIPKAPAWPHSIDMAGWHAEAVAVALHEFRNHQGGKTAEGKPVYGDLRHYSVHISRSDKDYIPLQYVKDGCVRITFAPQLSARDRREVTLGGRTDYGIEVSYDITRRELKILKTSFAR